MGLTGASTIRYFVNTYNPNLLFPDSIVDNLGPYTYNVGAQGLDFGGNILYEDLPGVAIPVTFDTNNLVANGSLGALLLHHHNKPGSTAEVLTVPVVSGAAPLLLSAVSRKVHGAAGTFNLPLTLAPAVNTNPTTEPRLGPTQTIVFHFDKPIDCTTPPTVTVTEGSATAGVPTCSVNDVIVDLTGVTDIQYVAVTLSDVTSMDGGTGGTGDVRVGYLAGDVNQNRVVSVSDVGLVNGVISQAVSAGNYLRDVNANGTLTVSDKGVTITKLTHALPTP